MIPGLLVTEGPNKGAYIDVPEGEVFWIGRALDNHFRIEDDPMVSGKHSHFLRKGKILCMKDQSRNGTRLNSRKIHQNWALLKLADILRIGRTHFQVIDLEEDETSFSEEFDIQACLNDLDKREEFADDSHSFVPIGPYHPIEVVGLGSFGVVYKAIQREEKKLVALKVFLDKEGPGNSFMGRFLREAELLKKLNHPHFIHLYDAGRFQVQGKAQNYIAMEYFPGVNLKAHIKAHGPLSWQKTIKLLIPLVEALDHMHSSGIIHRDLKPENILYNGIKKIAKIIDLGFGKCILDEERQTLFITQTGSSLGTPYYMPIEQWEEAKTVTEVADIYSLGATAYFLLSGHAPYEAYQDYLALFRAISQQQLVPLEQLAPPNTPKELLQVIHKMMAFKPKERYRTSRKLLKALHALTPL